MSQEKNTHAAQVTKTSIAIVIVLLLAGTVISFFAVKANGIVVGYADAGGTPALPDQKQAGSLRSDAAGSGAERPTLPADEKERALLAARGQRLEKEQCSACHMLNDQFIGPAYNDIVDNNGDVRVDPLDLLVPEINHPATGWSNYARGPQVNLPSNDRLALAYWIVESVRKGGRQK
jgi:cytochrome c551/c552